MNRINHHDNLVPFHPDVCRGKVGISPLPCQRLSSSELSPLRDIIKTFFPLQNGKAVCGTGMANLFSANCCSIRSEENDRSDQYRPCLLLVRSLNGETFSDESGIGRSRDGSFISRLCNLIESALNDLNAIKEESTWAHLPRVT